MPHEDAAEDVEAVRPALLLEVRLTEVGAQPHLGVRVRIGVRIRVRVGVRVRG